MTQAAQPNLEPGRVYRTQAFSQWSANPPRLAKRLVHEGKLIELKKGLYLHPKASRFGQVPASDEALLSSFLKDTEYVVTGPERWNALGLGSTAMFAAQLVYNTKRSGTFELGGRRFVLRRVAFPSPPTAEWFVVDLFEHADQAGVSRETLTASLTRALQEKRFDRGRLWEAAEKYGTAATRKNLTAAERRATA